MHGKQAKQNAGITAGFITRSGECDLPPARGMEGNRVSSTGGGEVTPISRHIPPAD